MQCWESFFTDEAHFGLRSGGFSLASALQCQETIQGLRYWMLAISPCDELVMHSGIFTHADEIGFSDLPETSKCKVKNRSFHNFLYVFYLYQHVLWINQNSFLKKHINVPLKAFCVVCSLQTYWAFYRRGVRDIFQIGVS